MTSQINSNNSTKTDSEARDCRPPGNASTEYCQKLKNGIARLQGVIQSHYEEAFPAERESIARALGEAEKAAWATPFPSLFFPALAELRLSERIPLA